MPRRCRPACLAKEEDKADGEAQAEEAAAAEEAGAVGEGPVTEEAGAEEEAEVDPFAGLDLDSKEFLQRKVEILEKELADAGARVAELEADAATVQVGFFFLGFVHAHVHGVAWAAKVATYIYCLFA